MDGVDSAVCDDDDLVDEEVGDGERVEGPCCDLGVYVSVRCVEYV